MLFARTAGEHHVPVANITPDQDNRLRAGAGNPTGKAGVRAMRHGRIHFAGDRRIRAGRSTVGHVVDRSDLLRAVSARVVHS